MKINWNKKYTTIAIRVGSCGAIIIFLIFLGVYASAVIEFLNSCFSVFTPIIIGLSIAYLLNPLLKLIETKLFRKLSHARLKRAFSLTLTYVVFFAVIVLLSYALIPQLTRSFGDLQNNLIVYANSLQAWIDSVSEASPMFGELLQMLSGYIDISSFSESLSHLFSSLSSILMNMMPYIISFFSSFMVSLKNILIGIIFSVYLLASKELVAAQIKKLLHSSLSPKHYDSFASFVKYTDNTFGRFLIGKIVDSAIIGIGLFFILLIFRVPYPALISVICGVTNIIPVFGPFIGAIPSFIIILISDPFKAFLFLIIIIIVQQIDGNLLGPAILGGSMGISALAVFLSVTVAGGFFGLAGMIIGVPLYAILSKFINRKLNERIAHRNAEKNPTETKAAEISEDNASQSEETTT